jgi:hypothetical protein
MSALGHSATSVPRSRMSALGVTPDIRQRPLSLHTECRVEESSRRVDSKAILGEAMTRSVKRVAGTRNHRDRHSLIVAI